MIGVGGEGDRLQQRGRGDGSRIGIERDDQVGGVGPATGECSDLDAGPGDGLTIDTDLAGGCPHVPNAKSIGGLAAREEADMEDPGIEVGRVGIGDSAGGEDGGRGGVFDVSKHTGGGGDDGGVIGGGDGKWPG